jgi:DNA-binding MltR family transcriptional regulator
VEHYLDEVLETRLRQLTDKERDTVFSDAGIFPSLSRKILGAYALGLIGPKARRELDLLRVIRNEAAHNMNPVTFETPTIRDRVRELALIKAAPKELELLVEDAKLITSASSLKERFIMSLRFLALALMFVRDNWEKPSPEPPYTPEFLIS